MKYDADGNLLPHEYREIQSWFGKKCEKCSYAKDAAVHIAPVLPHDGDLEHDVLGVALREQGDAGRQYARLVSDGLRAGDRLYGRKFEELDNLAEAQEEISDAGCYLILELERLRRLVTDDVWQELRMNTISGLLAAYQLHMVVRTYAGVRDSRG